MKQRISIFWFRRDLRLEDNHALFKSLTSSNKVLPIFIFDPEILKQFPDIYDKRVSFIYQSLEDMNLKINKEYKSNIQYFYGKPIEVFKSLDEAYIIDSLYFNEDYEPYAIRRDNDIKDYFDSKNIKVFSFKDSIIFHKDAILKSDNKPYTVYTPYSKVWLEKFGSTNIENYPSEEYLYNLLSIDINNFNLESGKIYKVEAVVPEAKNLDEVELRIDDINQGKIEGFKSANLNSLTIDGLRGWKFVMEVSLI